MSFLPLVVMDGILLVVTVLLVIADRLLINYGECKITVKQEGQEKEFVVQGGNYLITDLTANKINVSSSCGGKATCGYCKVRVLEGGGEILPTEEVFMGRQEKLDNMRLACQVKVRNDIEIYIPDYLTTVKEIVKNRSYDPKLRWFFNLGSQADFPEEPRVRTKLAPRDKAKVDEIIHAYKDKKGSLILILQSVNNSYNYFPENILWYISFVLEFPFSQVFRVATFYNAFSLKPRGKNMIRVCMGTSCYVKGGKRLLGALEDKLHIKVSETTKDLKFSLETVNCIGCCGQSPGVSVNDDIYGYVKANMVDDILRKYK